MLSISTDDTVKNLFINLTMTAHFISRTNIEQCSLYPVKSVIFSSQRHNLSDFQYCSDDILKCSPFHPISSYDQLRPRCVEYCDIAICLPVNNEPVALSFRNSESELRIPTRMASQCWTMSMMNVFHGWTYGCFHMIHMFFLSIWIHSRKY